MSESVFVQRLERYTSIHRRLLAAVRLTPGAGGEPRRAQLLVLMTLAVYGVFNSGQCMAAAWPSDVDQIAYNGTPFLAMILVNAKLINYIFRWKDNQHMMRIVQQFWHENLSSPRAEQEVMVQYARQVFVANIVQSMTMFAAAPMWLLIPLVEMAFNSHRHQFQRILPFDHWIPFNLNPFADPLYEILYLSQILQVCSGVVTLTAMDCLYVHFVMALVAQFKLLQMRIKNFDKDNNGTELSVEQQEKNVFNCIESHQQLLKYCQQLEDMLTVTMLFQFFVGVGFLCAAGFIITMFPGKIIIAIQNVLCMAASLAELFLICFTANLLTTEGTEVAFAAYSSEWSSAPDRIKKNILFMIMRAQRPIYLTVGKFTPVSVATFETITRTAASYFTVLTSMREDN